MNTSEKFIELKATGSLPSPTGTAMKLIELCQQNDVALPEIIHTLQSDPGLVGRVLKMANSPVYGRMRPVVSLSQDVLMTIGFQSLRQVCWRSRLFPPIVRGNARISITRRSGRARSRWG